MSIIDRVFSNVTDTSTIDVIFNFNAHYIEVAGVFLAILIAAN